MMPFRCHKQLLDMTKTELQVALAAATETNKRTAGVFLETLSALAYKEIKKNGEFVLPGFGKLVKQKRKARTGFNPKTQQKIKIPAKTVVKFRVAKAAKDAVLGGKEVVQILLLFVLFGEWNFSIAVRSRLPEVSTLPIMTPILAKVTAIEKRGDQYQVIVKISPKYRGSFNTLAFGEIKPHSGSLKEGRLDLVYYQDPDLNIGDPFRLWTLH